MEEFLFEEFPTASPKQWKQQIQFDLKGADYNEKLIWKSAEGIDVKPFYTREDLKNQGEFLQNNTSKWRIAESIYVADAKKSNQRALEKIAKGCEALTFVLPSEDISIEVLLKDIILDEIPVFFKCEFLSEKFITTVSKNFHSLNMHFDPISSLVRTGNWYNNLETDLKIAREMATKSRVLHIDASIYQNAGASISQQLAYGLAHLNEYFNILNKQEKNTFTLYLKTAIGSNYFFEISKLRAFRSLIDILSRLYNFTIDLKIHALPSKRNKTVYDYNTNLLRTTTECMSAILGGADFVENLPYDTIYNKTNSFSDRIARNQLLILKHESGFDEVAGFAKGSYYIETLTDKLTQKGLEIFKEIEKGGGFLKGLKSGKIQTKISENAEEEQSLFDSGTKKLVGTNYVINKEDEMAQNITLYPFLKTNPRKTFIEPILEKRLSDKIEKERLKKEKEKIK